MSDKLAVVEDNYDWQELLKQGCEDSLSFFVRMFFKVLEPEREYQHNWHIDVLCDHAEAVYYGNIKNLDVNIPPRTIKSLVFNVFFPCWTWTKNPSFKVISGSHSADLSTGFNMKRRELIQSKEFQSFWPIQFKDDSNKQNYFANTKNGFMTSASVGGKVTGKGGDILIMDDSLDAQDAHSETKRVFANSWYSTSFYNRLQNKKEPKRINVMQRLHENDLSGHIAEKYDFERLVIPMQKKDGQVQTSLGWTDPRKVNEFIHPERYSDQEKEDEYKGLGAYGWAGQMQQEPAPAGGGIIKRDWIRVESILGRDLSNSLISVDATFKDSKGSDFVVSQMWAKCKADFILVDMIRGRWDFTATLRRVEAFHTKYKPKKLLIEDKANGPAIISILKKSISGIKAINPKDSKIARVHAVSHFFECKNVIINKDIEGLEDFIKELVLFPNATHDDMVDAMSQAIEEMREKDSVDLIFA